MKIRQSHDCLISTVGFPVARWHLYFESGPWALIQYKDVILPVSPTTPHTSSSPGPWFNIKMPSHQYRKSHCGDKTVVRLSYLHNGISYTGKISFLYWIGVLVLGDELVYDVVGDVRWGEVASLWGWLVTIDGTDMHACWPLARLPPTGGHNSTTSKCPLLGQHLLPT